MDVVELTRKLGHAIQADERYLKYVEAKQANDADESLQILMSRLNGLQSAYQLEAAKESPDSAKMDEFDEEFQNVYSEIMTHPTMRVFEDAKQELDDMMNYTVKLLSLFVRGEDPDTAEPADEFGGCSGSCSTCGGCS